MSGHLFSNEGNVRPSSLVPRQLLTLFLVLLLGFVLIGCGGGSGGPVFDVGDGTFEPPTDPTDPSDPTAPSDPLNVASIQARGDKIQIAGDGKDFATITVFVKDGSNIGVEGVPITISVEPPEFDLRVDSKRTSNSGEVTARLFSGVNLLTGNALVTASVDGTDKVSNQIGFTFVGASLSVDPTSLDLVVGEKKSLTVTARDGTGARADSRTICFELPAIVQSQDLVASETCPAGAVTDGEGRARIGVEGVAAGSDARITVSGLGFKLEVPLTVRQLGISFDAPTETSAFPKVADCDVEPNRCPTVRVRVTRYEGDIRLATTSGVLSEDGSLDGPSMIEIPVVDGQAIAELRGFDTGRVTLLAQKLQGEPEEATVTFFTFDDSALEPDFTNLALQASPSTVSVGRDNEVIINATVTRSVPEQDSVEPVPPGTLVSFQILGSSLGASLNTPLALTDNAGRATVRLTAGETPSAATGLKVEACVVALEDRKCDQVGVTITENPGSISIGLGNALATSNEETAYALPISVIATDINGGALANREISLRVWPVRFATGTRAIADVTIDGSSFLEGDARRVDVFVNEDQNRNVVRDLGDGWSSGGNGLATAGTGFIPITIQGERTPCAAASGAEPGFDPTDNRIDWAFENKCKLLPESTSAGAVPAIVVTDENGFATFTLNYLKDRAGFVEAELRATTEVQGTEVQSVSVFWLPRLDEDTNLPVSPYNPFFE